MRRIESHELLDHAEVDPADRERSLRDLRRINTVFGAHRAYQLLIRRLTSGGQTYSVLDLGTGSSDLLEPLDGARRIGLDFKLSHLLYGRRLSSNGSVTRVAADALKLPFEDGSIDVIGSSHFFHHFSPDQNASLLTEAMRVARIGVFATDSLRHPLVFGLVQVMCAAHLVGRVTRHDAPASVRQAYTRREVEEIARRVPASRFAVISIVPFRFGLLLWKPTSR